MFVVKELCVDAFYLKSFMDVKHMHPFQEWPRSTSIINTLLTITLPLLIPAFESSLSRVCLSEKAHISDARGLLFSPQYQKQQKPTGTLSVSGTRAKGYQAWYKAGRQRLHTTIWKPREEGDTEVLWLYCYMVWCFKRRKPRCLHPMT